MGPLDKDVVRPDALSASGDALTLELHTHWYRALPLSSLGVVDIAIDGTPVPTSDLSVTYAGRRYSFSELADEIDTFWFTTDALEVGIPHPGATAGERYRVRVDLGLRIPYILVGPPEHREPLLASSLTDTTLVCH